MIQSYQELTHRRSRKVGEKVKKSRDTRPLTSGSQVTARLVTAKSLRNGPLRIVEADADAHQ
eukprot:SAG11_NODE_30589_length_299_cov_1.505000_1_plen_61_part_10